MNRRLPWVTIVAAAWLPSACSSSVTTVTVVDAGEDAHTSVGGAPGGATGTGGRATAGGASLSGIGGSSLAADTTSSVGGFAPSTGGVPTVGSDAPGAGGDVSTGGGSTTVGSITTGGTAAIGSTSMTGGSAPVGSTNALGGTQTTGGVSASVPTGGLASIGGTHSVGSTTTGGMPATGGAPPTGGMAATAGTPAIGGTPATGGAPPTGGVTATGGAPPTGGMPATGGAPPTGGMAATGGCANISTDPLNCGACNNKCQWGVCRSGACPTTSPIGSTVSTAGSYVALPAGQIFWQSVTVTTASLLVGFGIDITTNTSSAGDSFAVAIYGYNTSTGMPSNLVASSGSITAVLGLNEIPITPMSIAAGNYFLAVASQSTNPGLFYVSGTTTSRTSYYCSSCYSGTLPASAPTSLPSSAQPLLHLYAVTMSP